MTSASESKTLLDRKHLELMKMFDLYMGAAKNEKEYKRGIGLRHRPQRFRFGQCIRTEQV